MNQKVTIRRLPTGVPGLDELLGGGIPEFSFNLIAGSPGSGKTTLAHQMMFSLTGPDCRALFFTVLGEPPLKMLRYQQQFSFSILKKSINPSDLSTWLRICLTAISTVCWRASRQKFKTFCRAWFLSIRFVRWHKHPRHPWALRPTACSISCSSLACR